MRYLLGTHLWLWFAVDPQRIKEPVRAAILAADSEVSISVASIWEIAIKASAGKLALPATVDRFVAEYGEAAGFAFLSILPHHAAAGGAPAQASQRSVRPAPDRAGCC